MRAKMEETRVATTALLDGTEQLADRRARALQDTLLARMTHLRSSPPAPSPPLSSAPLRSPPIPSTCSSFNAPRPPPLDFACLF